MAETGLWNDPPFWTTQAYLQASPWGAPELAAAFNALGLIFTTRRTRGIFSRRPVDGYLRVLLTDQHAPILSPLLELGLDAAVCRAWERRSWVDSLVADGRSFKGAAFEIAVASALVRMAVPTRHEPLKNIHPRNPDFAIGIDGREILLEVKLAREGDLVKEENDRLTKFVFGSDRALGIPGHLELLEGLDRLQDEQAGRRALDENIARLVQLVDDAKIRLASSPTFPASEVLDGCVRVTVSGPRGTSGAVDVLGTPMNSTREAARIIQNLLVDGAGQIPEDRIGVVLIDPGSGIASDVMASEVQRWLGDEGGAYPQVTGVLLLSRQYFGDIYDLPITVVTPEWRDNAPDYLRQSDVWNRMTAGLSWADVCRFKFRRER